MDSRSPICRIMLALAAIAAPVGAGCGADKSESLLRIYVAPPTGGRFVGSAVDERRAIELALAQAGRNVAGHPISVRYLPRGTTARVPQDDPSGVAAIGAYGPVKRVIVRRVLAISLDPAGAGMARDAQPDTIWVVPRWNLQGQATARDAAGRTIKLLTTGSSLTPAFVAGLKQGAAPAAIAVRPGRRRGCESKSVASVVALRRPGEVAPPLTTCRGFVNYVVDTPYGPLPVVPTHGTGLLVTPALAYNDLPGEGKSFYGDFKSKFGHYPDRWAIFSYEAAKLTLASIDAAAKVGPVTPEAVIKAAFATRDRDGATGHYDVLPDGQTTLYTVAVRKLPLPADPTKQRPVGDDTVVEVVR